MTCVIFLARVIYHTSLSIWTELMDASCDDFFDKKISNASHLCPYVSRFQHSPCMDTFGHVCTWIPLLGAIQTMMTNCSYTLVSPIGGSSVMSGNFHPESPSNITQALHVYKSHTNSPCTWNIQYKVSIITAAWTACVVISPLWNHVTLYPNFISLLLTCLIYLFCHGVSHKLRTPVIISTKELSFTWKNFPWLSWGSIKEYLWQI